MPRPRIRLSRISSVICPGTAESAQRRSSRRITNIASCDYQSGTVEGRALTMVTPARLGTYSSDERFGRLGL